MQREMAVFEDPADPNGEGLAAGVTLAQARTARFSRQATDSLVVAIAAMGANRTFRPKMGFDVGKSGLFVVEMRGGKTGLAMTKSPMAATLSIGCGVVKCNVAN